MSEDYFYGVTLTAANKEVKWEPDELKENGTGDISLTPRGEHCLSLKQAVLTGAPDGDVNVVEVETTGYKANVKIPVIVLVGGKTTHSLLDLSFPDPPVTLRLIEGSGPVHISGNHIISSEQFNDDDDDDDDDMDDIDEEDEEDAEVDIGSKGKDDKQAKKRINSSPGQPQQSKKKRGAKDD